jgi:hypothetical protein
VARGVERVGKRANQSLTVGPIIDGGWVDGGGCSAGDVESREGQRPRWEGVSEVERSTPGHSWRRKQQSWVHSISVIQ